MAIVKTVHLKELSFISPVIESAEVFRARETAIPADAIEQAIGKTNSQQERQRKLPSQHHSVKTRKAINRRLYNNQSFVLTAIYRLFAIYNFHQKILTEPYWYTRA